LPGEAQEHRHGYGGGREGDHDAGDEERLRHRIGGQAGGRAAARDGAEQEEHAAAHDVEREDLAQRMRVHDDPVGAKPDQDRGGDAEERAGTHGDGGRSGAPARRSARMSVSDGISASSIAMMSGFA
jgi:hypothetical protein